MTALVETPEAMPFSDLRYLVAVRTSEIFAIKSRSCPKSRRNFVVLGQPNFWGMVPSCWPTFVIRGQHRTCGKFWWRSSIGQATCKIRWRKNKKKEWNIGRKTEWPRAVCYFKL